MVIKGTQRRKTILGVPVPRKLPAVDVKKVAKSVGKASKQFGETSKSVSKDIERVGNQAERIGKILVLEKSEEAAWQLRPSRDARRTAGANGASSAVAKAGGSVLGRQVGEDARRHGGVPLGGRPGLAGSRRWASRLRAAAARPAYRTHSRLFGKAAKELGSATKQVSSTTDDIRKVREELEQANRRSPVEVLLERV